MKNRRILSLVMVMIFTLSLTLEVSSEISPLNGDDVADDAVKLDIIVGEPHTFNGQTINAYMLFKLEIDNNSTGHSDDYVYMLNPDFEDFDAAFLNESTLQDYIYEYSSYDAKMVELNVALLNYITEKDIYPVKTATTSVYIDDTNEVSLSPDEHGFYLISGNISLNRDYDDASPFSALISTNYGEGFEGIPNSVLDVFLKVDTPTITGTSDAETLSIGEKVTYTLNTEVPNTAGFSSYIFKITDTMSLGLTFDVDSLLVTVGGIRVEQGSDFTLNVENGFELEFISDVFLTYNSGDEIIVSYSAVLNENAVTAGESESNKVILEYSNNPADPDGTTATPPAQKKVYTFSIEIFKYTGSLESPTPLSGTEFILSKSPNIEDAIADPINLVADNPPMFMERGEVMANHYRVATNDDSSDYYIDVITGDGGFANIRGLDVGTYYLHEIASPLGYTALTSAIEIVIEYKSTNNAYIYIINGQLEGSDNRVNVENCRRSPFPDTGGLGRLLIYAGGVVLLGGSVALILAFRKKSSINK